MPKIMMRVIEIATQDVVEEFEVKGATSLDDRKVEKVEMGLLRNMDLENYSAIAMEVDE